MNFDLTAPCKECPFRTDIKPYLRRKRAMEIFEAIAYQDQTFSCHKTVTHDDDGEPINCKDEQHCAGALILLEHMERPNQLMRIAERLGGYDRSKLKMDSPVFTCEEDFEEAEWT